MVIIVIITIIIIFIIILLVCRFYYSHLYPCIYQIFLDFNYMKHTCDCKIRTVYEMNNVQSLQLNSATKNIRKKKLKDLQHFDYERDD